MISPIRASDPSAGRAKNDTLATVDGRAASLGDALSRAASLLKAARFPLVVSGGDLAATNAALDLAEVICGGFAVLDGESAELVALSESCSYLTSRREAFARADVILPVGSRAESDPFIEKLRASAPSLTENQRAILTLPAFADDTGSERNSVKIGLAVLAALASPDPAPGFAADDYSDTRDIAAQLKSAKFGAIVWSPEELDGLEIASLQGLVEKLNAQTRFTALPLRPGGNALGNAQLCIARWGAPPPLRWMGGRAVSAFLGLGSPASAAPEVDLILAISSFSDIASLPLSGRAPLIKIAPGACGGKNQKIAIEAGATGRDHGGIFYDAEADAYVSVEATVTGGAPSAAELIGELTERVKGAAA